MKRLLLTAALCATALPAFAFDVSEMTDAERSAFRAEIRSYLLENPEVLLEAIEILETREAEAQAAAETDMLAANQEALFADGHSFVGGNPDGDVTIVEFIDYRCGYCRRAHPEIEELVASDGNIRLIVKEFPILGEGSVLSSRFAISTLLTEGPEAYKNVHDALINLRADPTEDVLAELGETLVLDTDAILNGMEAEEVTEIIRKNRTLAQGLQISGTPTFVVGETLLRGYVPLDGMRDIVADVRADQG